MQNIRTFIAIPLSPEVSKSTTKLIKRMSDSIAGVKWVPVDNLHITLKFLGDVDNTIVPDICNVIRSVCHQYDPFGLSFAGTGGFPNVQKPRILYAGATDETGTLVKIVSELETELADLGFKPEPRDYTPHLTLGRCRTAREEVGSLLQEFDDVPISDLGEMEVDTVNLVASFMDREGPTYQTMDTIYLG